MQKTRFGSYLLAIATICFAPGAAAASWYETNVGTDESLYFFDADTVERSPSAVTVWFKTVQISSASTDGAWSTAYRWRFNCSARTLQLLAWSDYGNDGSFIRASNRPGTSSPVHPDSTGEAMLKIVCESNFPRDASAEKYLKLESNDVFKGRDAFVRYKNSRIDTAPK